MATTWGKVLDQASIMLSRQDLEKACIKATRHDNMIPKEKHVRRLVVCTHERSDLTEKIYQHLAERLEVPDWIVVLKTLEVYHRLFRDGNPRFLAELKWKGTIFPLSKFNDPTSAEAHTQSVFIRKYALYLEEKVLVYRALRMEFERDPGLLKNLSVEESFVRLPKIQRQLDALINCQTSAEAITNPITALAFEMLLKDSFKLYRGLNDGIITLLESYFTMDKSLALTALEIYKTFMRETSSIIAMYEMAKKKFTLELPDLKHAPTTLVNSLEDYLRDSDDTGFDRQRERLDDKRRSHSPVPSPKKQQQQANSNIHSGNSQTFNNNNNAPSLIDPFGVSDLISQPVAAQPVNAYHAQAVSGPPANLFDPFGDSFSTTTVPQQQPLHTSSSAFSNGDPFTTPTNYGNHFAIQPQTQAHTAYAEKAQQIKASYTPSLQPNSPTFPTTNQPTTYPKPNYNVSFGAQPSPQFTPQYNNAPVVYGTGPYVTPSAQYSSPPTQFSSPPTQYSSPQVQYSSPPLMSQPQQQPHPANPFL
eukprot:Phypoly_transcript_05574.p1 GENE.Phypoly_transcript_05574~~Phypoly_transcript_05574.p1  ORF type:complete len:532 (+),score=100.90 Phypoly_transcript_05574:69-1664(+)